MADNIVVSDAGPLPYLLLIDCAEVLASLFDHVLVPFAVRDEFHPRAPQKVKNWILQPRSWLEITPVAQVQQVRGLHKGETEALQLALERKAAEVLMDDLDGRGAERRLGLSAIFTIAILELTAEKGIVDLLSAVAKLQQTYFFMSQEILLRAFERDRQRREKEK